MQQSARCHFQYFQCQKEHVGILETYDSGDRQPFIWKAFPYFYGISFKIQWYSKLVNNKIQKKANKLFQESSCFRNCLSLLSKFMSSSICWLNFSYGHFTVKINIFKISNDFRVMVNFLSFCQISATSRFI